MDNQLIYTRAEQNRSRNPRSMDKRSIERRRQLRRRRRQQQILCRLAVLIGGILLAVTVVWKIVSSIAGGNPKNLTAQQQVEEQPRETLAGFPAEKTAVKKTKEQICIVLDAGHGGKDPGTLWKDVYEKDINILIVKKLEKLLTEAGFQVKLTRSGDEALTLKERVKIAKDNNADVFVSIHQNALERDTKTSGIEIYCSQTANSKSPGLADAIHGYLLDNTNAIDKGVKKDSDLYVILNSTMPACLIETGFLTSTEERAKLLDEDYQEKIARGVADGIIKFLEEEVLDTTL